MSKILLQLGHKINRMAILDQKMRKSADNTGKFDLDLDTKHANNLKKIIGDYGWPTIELVGKKASHNAWLLVQHADHDVFFQKECLDLMKKAWNENHNSVSKMEIAFLQDRILVNRGKKQLYGTQFYLNRSGRFIPRPIEDLKNVDKRRTEFGLQSLQDDIQSAKKYQPARFKKVA